ncbi:complex I subunit 4 family protein [Ferrimicrobium acidiphilum]|uniref:complex I subunit 4 family protein n=1 Tax=Ferrimicrobium acidiphilum TaxID=121039 RepID=UPI0023F00385|nr:NADH-quinone oxidoreductase subunit M [Ferrimicrobium acidiphilum]
MTLLDWLIALPALGALVVPMMSLPADNQKLVRYFGIAISLVELGIAIGMAIAFKLHTSSYQFVTKVHWIGAFGIAWYLGADGISLVLVLLTAVLFAIAMFAMKGVKDYRAYVGWMLLLEAACMGSFTALDLFLFFVFFELTLVPSYFLISDFGLGASGRAAIKFFVYTFAGSALLLIGIVSLVFIHDHQTGHLTFSLPALMHTKLPKDTAILLFLAFAAAFAVKTPIFPFHTWSPDTYRAAPIPAVVILAGVMAKLGAYGLIRFDLELFPATSRELAWLMLTLGVAGILYGAIVAAGERDLGRMVAYSSLSHMGFIVLGIFAFSTEGLSGSTLQMVNHGIYTAAIFLLLGMIYERRGTLDMNKLGGLQKKAPIFAAVFILVVMGMIGLPGLNGFVGEFLILLGTFITHRWWAVVAVLGVVLSAVYLLWAYQRVFHGEAKDEHSFRDLAPREALLLLPLVAIIVFLGIYPVPLLSRINPTTSAIVHHVKKAPALTNSPVSSAAASITTGGAK